MKNKIQKQGKEFVQWLQNGSYVYVCGSKDPMSRDVEQSIINAVKEHAGKSESEAISYLAELKETGRYCTDVY